MPNRFQWIRTADGSPSLIDRSDAGAEAMHSRAGAFAESLEIYDRATALAMRNNWPGHFLSVGLGLGYNEIILAARALREGEDQLLSLTSLETSDFLIERFKNWLSRKERESSWAGAYDTIAAMAEARFGQKSGSVRKYLEVLYKQNQWDIGGKLNQNYNFSRRASAIFYDAYSSKACPELWSEDLLGHLLENGAAEKCVFTTYAFTGSLKRALTSARFTLMDVTGFAGKRHSTFAVRNPYSNSINR